jgi:DNA-binding CsgD family transcriptional regulator
MGRRQAVRAVTIARGELAHAWAEPDAYMRVANILAEMVPGSVVGMMRWEKTAHDVPFMLATAGTCLDSAMKTPWVSSGRIVKHRPYDPRRRDPFANRVADLGMLAGRAGNEALRQFKAGALAPMGLRAYMRTTLYDGGDFVAMCGIGRACDDDDFEPSHRAAFETILPDLLHGLGALRALHDVPLEPGSVAAIADGLDRPALIVDSRDRVLYANRMARRVFVRWPEWLSVSASERPAPRSAVVRCVPLVAGARRYYLLMTDRLSADADTAPSATWARKWRLAPREAKVAAALLQGNTDKEIADRLQLTTQTARTYVKRVFARAAVHSRTELQWAAARIAAGLTENDE